MLDEALVQRLHRQANGDRWRVSVGRFDAALTASVERAFAGRQPQPAELGRYLTALHLDDLALACACADGDEEAWEHFVRELRPVLYRAADAIAPGGAARDLADALYGDLFGIKNRGGERRSLLKYFHGRSSLTTWLRAVLSQRHVDRLRAEQRVDPFPDDDSAAALPAPSVAQEPERDRDVSLMRQALGLSISRLPARDRLRLGCYYAQELTLAETGRILKEHEATVSRQLARTRGVIRAEVEAYLREHAGFSSAEIARCFESISADAGPLDLQTLLGDGTARKKSALDRSQSKEKAP